MPRLAIHGQVLPPSLPGLRPRRPLCCSQLQHLLPAPPRRLRFPLPWPRLLQKYPRNRPLAHATRDFGGDIGARRCTDLAWAIAVYRGVHRLFTCEPITARNVRQGCTGETRHHGIFSDGVEAGGEERHFTRMLRIAIMSKFFRKDGSEE